MTEAADYMAASLENERALIRKNVARKSMEDVRRTAHDAVTGGATAAVIKKALAAAVAAADAFDVAVTEHNKAQQRRQQAQAAFKGEAPF